MYQVLALAIFLFSCKPVDHKESQAKTADSDLREFELHYLTRLVDENDSNNVIPIAVSLTTSKNKALMKKISPRLPSGKYRAPYYRRYEVDAGLLFSILRDPDVKNVKVTMKIKDMRHDMLTEKLQEVTLKRENQDKPNHYLGKNKHGDYSVFFRDNPQTPTSADIKFTSKKTRSTALLVGDRIKRETIEGEDRLSYLEEQAPGSHESILITRRMFALMTGKVIPPEEGGDYDKNKTFNLHPTCSLVDQKEEKGNYYGRYYVPRSNAFKNSRIYGLNYIFSNIPDIKGFTIGNLECAEEENEMTIEIANYYKITDKTASIYLTLDSIPIGFDFIEYRGVAIDNDYSIRKLPTYAEVD